MGFLFSMSMKNLFRYTRRTIITSIAIAAGIAIYIIIDGMMLGVEKESERNLIWYETGSASIFNESYWEEREYTPLKKAIKNPDAIVERLTQQNVPATKRLSFPAELFSNGSSFQALMSGIDPATDETVFRIKRNNLITDGEYLVAGREEVLLGSGLARELNVKAGGTIEMRMRTMYGAYNTVALRVTGVITSPNPVVDKAVGLIPIDIAEDILDMTGMATHISVLFPEAKSVEDEMSATMAVINAHFPGLVIQDYNTLSGNPSVIASKKKIINILLFLIVLIAIIGISNTMLMAVYERVREIGMMRALGMDDGAIRLIFTFEAGGIGLIGSTIGTLLGVIGNWLMVVYGLDYSSMMGELEMGYRIYPIFRSAWNPQAIITAFLIGLIAAGLCSFIPSRKALRMQITDCLRFQ